MFGMCKPDNSIQKPFENLDFEGGFCWPVHLAHNDIIYIRVIIWDDLGPGSKRMINTPPKAEFRIDSKSGSPTFVLCLVEPKKKRQYIRLTLINQTFPCSVEN
jgi:hypothetical protein